MLKTQYNPLLAALISIFLWSLMPIISIFSKGISPFITLFIAFFSGFIFYVIYWSFKHGSVFARWPKSMGYFLETSITLFLADGAYVIAMQVGKPIETHLIANLWPIMALFMSAVILKQQLKYTYYVGALLGFVGVALISSNNGFHGFSRENIMTIILAFISPISWAFFTVVMNKYRDVPADTVGWSVGLAALFSLALQFISGESFATPSLNQFLAISFMGLAPWGIAYALWGYAMCAGNGHFYILLSYIGPILALTWMIILNYDHYNNMVALSAALVIAGAALPTILDLMSKKFPITEKLSPKNATYEE